MNEVYSKLQKIFIKGTCTCDEGYFGSDCSVEIRAGSPSRTTIPRTSSLANYGLCNIRAKPCRDIVVLGDGFVDHPSLTCIYETYKVRITYLTLKYIVNVGKFRNKI